MKNEITEKQLLELTDKNITVAVRLHGYIKLHFFGRICGRLRDRFKSYVFIPDQTPPYTPIYFTVHDVDKIEMPEKDTWLLSLKNNVAKRKRRKKPLVLFQDPPCKDGAYI